MLFCEEVCSDNGTLFYIKLKSTDPVGHAHLLKRWSDYSLRDLDNFAVYFNGQQWEWTRDIVIDLRLKIRYPNEACCCKFSDYYEFVCLHCAKRSRFNADATRAFLKDVLFRPITTIVGEYLAGPRWWTTMGDLYSSRVTFSGVCIQMSCRFNYLGNKVTLQEALKHEEDV